MRKTEKYTQAVRTMARALNKTVSEVERGQGDYQALYAALYLMGGRWDVNRKVWYFVTAPKDIKSRGLTGLPCRIRVMADTEIDAEIAGEYVVAALTEATATITRVSDVYANREGSGARIYIEAEL